MKIQSFILVLITILVSCEKPVPVSRKEASPTTQPTLAAAQLAIAKTYFENNRPEKALPYLAASLDNQPSTEKRAIFDDTLASTSFSVPTIHLNHPFPVLRIASSGKNLFAVIGGPFPTVVRWNLTDIPTVEAILFPHEAETISHLVLSPSGKYVIVQRDSTNLLCDAETLKPIASIGTLPPDLDPRNLQLFSENSLLVAHPVSSEHQTITWHIRDTATGEILRSETTPAYPRPTHAGFDNTTLLVALENGSLLTIPIIGDTEKQRANLTAPRHQPQTQFTFSGSTITRHQTITAILPLPQSAALLPALTGYELDPATQSLDPIPSPDRLQTLSELFPEIPSTLKIYSARSPIEARLAAAYPDTFPALSLAFRTHAQIVRESFATQDQAAILATISALPRSGLATATALLLAHESGDLKLVSAVLAHAENIPVSLKRIKTPGAEIPDLATLRGSEDWLGYEAPDFTSLFQNLRNEKNVTLSALTLSGSPTEKEILALFNKLLNPETLRQLGPHVTANLATSAARTLSERQDHATSALEFTALAVRMGAHPAEILRIRATAFTSLADFASAHRSWLDLITNQPEASHLPTDYSEAAYTAFENSDRRQAIEILETGIFRFPNHVDFAIRAGWIALLTGHPEKGVKYLSHATTLGLPRDEIENTTALLAIAHTQLGDLETANSYLAQLKAIDESWADPETVDKIPWPDSFQEALLLLIAPKAKIVPEPSPENDPIDTVLPSGEFPIQEPPLPSR